ncbi:MAG: hypothetical protein CMO80_16260 [Verrucomicrobiales bacterium]|nr:hypothetical protein [Verrucomicrobiales bacterium]|tara:strand:+ start:7390 stop:8265 length:876 start_codon:yes stop_codon:yes gene_type:complete
MKTFLTLVCFLAVLESVRAQPFSGRPPTTVRFTSSYTGEGAMSQGTRSLGDFDQRYYETTIRTPIARTGRLDWTGGLRWRRFDFDAPAAAPIPDSLQAVSLDLNVGTTIGKRWRLDGTFYPGIYSDFEDLQSEDFNTPGLIRIVYSQSGDLQWLLGLRIDPENDLPIVGGPGVRWRFADRWTLNFFFPSPNLTFKASEDLSFSLGADWLGGSFRVNDAFGSRFGRPELDGENVTVREIRAVASARYRLNETWRLSASAGYALHRRIAFEDSNLQLGAEAAPFFQLGVSARF